MFTKRDWRKEAPREPSAIDVFETAIMAAIAAAEGKIYDKQISQFLSGLAQEFEHRAALRSMRV